LGFLPESDCAPLVIAAKHGLFEQYGLDVELYCQPSWKRIHDKILHGELEAAQAPAMLPFVINLGLTEEKAHCVSSLVLSLQGASITISRELSRLGVKDAATLRELMWRDRDRKTYTFGVSGPLSVEYSLLFQWLKSVTSPPILDIRIEYVPPEQMYPLLKMGYLDGYCAAEPWGTVSVQAGVGVCLATSATLASLHPAKVLVSLKSFEVERPEENERLTAALLHACSLCEERSVRKEAAAILSQPHFVNAPKECLEPGLAGPFAPRDAKISAVHGLHVFHRDRANEPTPNKAAWLSNRLLGMIRSEHRPAVLGRIFRQENYRRAERLLQTPRAGQRREARREGLLMAV
jgi:ABC-type nitrate/sulfonate/bicarbonate transport system substrate-binding protein